MLFVSEGDPSEWRPCTEKCRRLIIGMNCILLNLFFWFMYSKNMQGENNIKISPVSRMTRLAMPPVHIVLSIPITFVQMLSNICV